MDESGWTEQRVDVEGLRQGRPDAVEGWFASFSDPIYSFIFYRVGKDRPLAEDIAQETFLTALESISRYDPSRGEMFPWLTYIARNNSRKALRHARRHVGVGRLWDDVDSSFFAGLQRLNGAALPDAVLERQETAELVRLALSQLAPRYQDLLRAHYFAEATIPSADPKAPSPGAARVRLHRARLAFKTAFEAAVSALSTRQTARSIER
jgi:RNA polymerase sigma-70 factor (ECF subfamily)